MAKSRPQPQVLVPLRGPVVLGLPSQPSSTSKIQQVQQRASILTSSVKGAQAFISSTGQRKSDAMNAPSPSTQTSNSQTQLAPVQNGKQLSVVNEMSYYYSYHQNANIV